jgi:pimeloyl-ACP methyl ester carboxylesterase
MIPFIDFDRSGQPLIFLHANGYPPECYQPLLAKLAERFHVSAMYQRPLWEGSKPGEINDWQPLTDDFLRFLDEHPSGPPIVVGHSMGGIAALRAAIRQPERFKALIMLDPVLFPPSHIVLWNFLRALNLGRRLHPLVRTAQKRRRAFDDREKVFSGYRRREVFRYFSNGALQTFIAGMTKPASGGGYELAYSPEWEVQIYLTGIWRDMELWRGLRTLKIPLLIIRGAETDTFFATTGQRVVRTNPSVRVETILKATHLVPLERPAETFELIRNFLTQSAGFDMDGRAPSYPSTGSGHRSTNVS